MRSEEDINLAILGSRPAFSTPLHVGRPNIGCREKLHARFNRMLDARWFSNNGPLVQEFEQEISKYIGVKHVICTCNATIALEIIIRACGLTREVIVPAYTFVATAHALQWQGITPVFADMRAADHTIDPEDVERRITPATTGILATHVWGNACAIEELTDIAARHKLSLLFDAAHAFGCSYRGEMVGRFGRAEVFSFHATKFLNSFEGGAICTNDPELARTARLMTNFGFAGFDNVVEVGTNGKMTEASAAMGLTSLESIDSIIAANVKNYNNYREIFMGIPGIRMLAYDATERRNYQYIVVEVDAQKTRLTRDELIYVLHSENVLARKYFWPGAHRMQPYRTLFPEAGNSLPVTSELAPRVIVFPTGTSVDESTIQVVGEKLRTAIANASRVRSAVRIRAAQ